MEPGHEGGGENAVHDVIQNSLLLATSAHRYCFFLDVLCQFDMPSIFACDQVGQIVVYKQ